MTKIPATMQAMVFGKAHMPLVLTTLPVPAPSSQQVPVRVIACGVCRGGSGDGLMPVTAHHDRCHSLFPLPGVILMQ